jgi:hypothetical protein
MGGSLRKSNPAHATTCTCASHNDAQLNRTSVRCYELSGGKYIPRAVLFDLEP